MKKYIISSYGADIAVGLLDKETAEEDINLAHNLLNSHVNNNYYNGVLNFKSLHSFYRFLINKYYLINWRPNKTFRQILKKATNKARQTIDNQVEFRNFMPQIYQYEYERSHSYKVVDYQWWMTNLIKGDE